MTRESGNEVDLSVDLAGVRLANPILTASGTCGYGPELSDFLDLTRLGAFTTKSVTVEERLGNPPPRVVETSAGMLNAIGLANVGLERFVAEKVPDLAKLGIPVFVNVAGHSPDDYLTVCRRLDPIEEIAGLELNVSCPNVADGMVFGADPDGLRDLVARVRAEVRRCILIVKLSPNVTDITATARAAVEAGADVISMVNTFVGMAIDIETWRPKLANNTGGMSGPAIKPMAVNLISKVYRTVCRDAGVPIVGMGGVTRWQDAVEFMLAGASAVAVGTALFGDPALPIPIIEGLQAYLVRRGLAGATDLVGRANLHTGA
ncbi:MAG: dihydroorotate dehydrogenase [Phycisphaerae bacterium]|nr:dihydroorotate dehydrogenase [Phycisphaerae bacterium]